MSEERPMSVVEEIAAERRLRIEIGWSIEDDDELSCRELAASAAAYALNVADCFDIKSYHHSDPPIFWPWDRECWMPEDPRRDLVRAAAMLVAEIERLDRAAGRATVA